MLSANPPTTSSERARRTRAICRKSRGTCARMGGPEVVRHRFSKIKLGACADPSLGEPPADSRARSLSADDLQTSKRLRRARAGHDEDDEDEDEDDEDDSDAELLAQVKKLDTRPPPTPARASR